MKRRNKFIQEYSRYTKQRNEQIEDEEVEIPEEEVIEQDEREEPLEEEDDEEEIEEPTEEELINEIKRLHILKRSVMSKILENDDLKSVQQHNKIMEQIHDLNEQIEKLKNKKRELRKKLKR